MVKYLTTHARQPGKDDHMTLVMIILTDHLIDARYCGRMGSEMDR